jgi:hypothetical protein
MPCVSFFIGFQSQQNANLLNIYIFYLDSVTDADTDISYLKYLRSTSYEVLTELNFQTCMRKIENHATHSERR